MSNLLKDIYSQSFYRQFSLALASVIPSFNRSRFMDLIFCDDFEDYELKERMSHTAQVMREFLPSDFLKATQTIKKIIQYLINAGVKEESIEFMFIPEYIEMQGIEDYELSIDAFEFITQFTSCEFAVRPFIIKYKKKMLKQMLCWSKHEHHMVRRLASEGTRPRLPWSISLPSLKENPEPLRNILKNLKNDEYEIVRRSVANSLNDISKDNPEFVITLAKQWLGENKAVDSLVKHGCRTLLKQANTEILRLFGFESKHFELTNFYVVKNVAINNELSFSFLITNKSKKSQILRLEYGLYYKRKNAELSKKVFKVSEREFLATETRHIERKQSFKLIATRKFYCGMHKLSIIINGKESELAEFELIA